MTIQSKQTFKKVFFPVGVFFLVYIVEALISVGSIGYYFQHTGKLRINDIVSYTKNYSITMGEAFADVAELSLKTKDFSTLKRLYQEKIRENTIDEAFFILKNGKIIVHSSKKITDELRGNLANDEFTYNMDMIQQPLQEKTKETTFSDYNIISIRSPFKRNERKLLRKYLYQPIESNGWLVTRAVYLDKKPAGTVSFIISKNRVFNFIKSHMLESRRYLLWSLAGSGAFALLISIFIFIRYRGIQKKTERILMSDISMKRDLDIIPSKHITPSNADITPYDKIIPGEDDIYTIDLSIQGDNSSDSESISMNDLVDIDGASMGNDIAAEVKILKNRQVKDPIPVNDKEASNDIH